MQTDLMVTPAGEITKPASDWRIRAWRIVGTVSVAIGLFNAFVPLLPTTIFLIIGVWAYGKGSPELQAKLLNHPRFGPTLRLWKEQRAMTRRAKIHCIAGITVVYGITLAIAGPKPAVLWVGAGLVILCLYLGTRPTAAPLTRSDAAPPR